MNKDLQHKKSKSTVVITILIITATLGSIIYFGWPYLSAMLDPDKARKLISDAGALGPIVFILMQVVQVLIAPIPGQVTGLVAGYLFGPFLGVLYTIIGATIGFTLIFILTKKYGRPFVERFVDKKYIDKFDYLSREKGVLIFFLIFLLPAFPDDLISFIAGLTTIKISTLIIISIAGRLPGYVMLCLTGNGFTYENLRPVFVAIFLLLVIFSLSWWKRTWLHDLVKHENRIQFLKKQIRASWLSITLWVLGILVGTILFYQLAAFVPLK